MKTTLILVTLIATFASIVYAADFAKSEHIEACDPSAKNLFIDIQIYQQTEKLYPSEGFAGEALEQELRIFRGNEDSLKDKVHDLETGFAKCNMHLSEDDQFDIIQEVDSLKKLKSPLTE